MPRGAGRIGWYLVWAVAFGSVGSSMYYVPGLLLHAAGPGAPALVGVLSIAFLALVLKEAELTRRHPSGGGAVSQVRETFGEVPAIAGGVLLLFDLALTIAVSVLAGVEQLDAAVLEELDVEAAHCRQRRLQRIHFLDNVRLDRRQFIQQFPWITMLHRRLAHGPVAPG